ncbi:hypothetical protein RQP54_17960 [Curvibacter sp. APW13]|uniref:hypothetical protein n=1 Tax=Curvibacter sp. APW13 TaxID=3077236 RepID=UPI0028DDD35F|nr:hypothetical protein [Curvibacter sp. APW13]MDT8992763.1 hypothetical protein [Curvibacter sp. APW13]
MNSTTVETSEDVCANIVRSALQHYGWAPCDGVAIASKTFATAVGPKVALAYLQNYGKDTQNYHLAGDYQSEGSNILEAQFVLLPKTASESTLKDLAKQFATNVAKTVAASYAGRLLHPSLKPGKFGTGPNGLPAIEWWRYGEAAVGEPSVVTVVREYPTDSERLQALEGTAF